MSSCLLTRGFFSGGARGFGSPGATATSRSSSAKLERFLECSVVSTLDGAASGLFPLETGRGADFELGASLVVLAFLEGTDIDLRLLPSTSVSSWSPVFRFVPCF